MPTPKPIAAPQMLREPLQPHLLLFAGDLPFDPTSVMPPGRYRPPPPTGPHRAALARLSWRYGPISIPSGLHRQPDRVVQHGGVLYQVVRDAKAEDQAAERARLLGLAQINHYHSLPQVHPHASDLTLLWTPTRQPGSSSCWATSRSFAPKAGWSMSPTTSRCGWSSRMAAYPSRSRNGRGSTGSISTSGSW